ncbi:MAG: methyltransferase domain-containing protein [Planctomycetaceae bacterium]|nr:methyltransferase domain-containing protein [Planctomycetaceae bacterium]
MTIANSNILASLSQIDSLNIPTVEAGMVELLSDVRDDRIPLAAQDTMHDYYDRYITWKNHFLHHFAPFVCEADELFSLPRRHPHLLDLGCGVATQAHFFAMRGASITGLDNKVERVKAGRAMTSWFEEKSGTSLNVQLHATDAFEMLATREPASFDGCYTQFALAYMRPHRKMLELIHRVVRPGGLILFREFNAGSLYNRLVSRVDWLNDRDYQRIGKELGWKTEMRQFCWFFPKQLTNPGSARHLLRPVEDSVARFSPIASKLAASMTLVFRR